MLPNSTKLPDVSALFRRMVLAPSKSKHLQGLYDSGMLLRFQDGGEVGIKRGISSFEPAGEDLYETGKHRLHLIDLSLLARNDLTAKFLDFRILDGRPFTHENSPRMMRDHRR